MFGEWVIVNQEDKTLSIIDTGIGMTKDELIKYLGTVGESGSKDYLESLKPKNINMASQYGVGFTWRSRSLTHCKWSKGRMIVLSSAGKQPV